MKKLFESHGIETKIENGILFCMDELFWQDGKITRTWVDTSTWTFRKALDFLGY